MIPLPADFKEFLKLLNSKGVEYLVVGGFAVNFHGYPRATANIDIWIALEKANAEKVADAIQEFGFSDARLSPSLFLKKNQIIRMGVPPIQIELHTSVSGVQFESCFKKRIVEKIDGTPVNLICLEDLKTNKKASGRHRDLDNIENLS